MLRVYTVQFILFDTSSALSGRQTDRQVLIFVHILNRMQQFHCNSSCVSLSHYSNIVSLIKNRYINKIISKNIAKQ